MNGLAGFRAVIREQDLLFLRRALPGHTDSSLSAKTKMKNCKSFSSVARILDPALVTTKGQYMPCAD